MPGSSTVWQYFTVCEDNKDLAECHLCHQKLSRKGSSTSCMRAHIRNQHKSIQLTPDSSSPRDASASGSRSVASSSKSQASQPNIKDSLHKSGLPKHPPLSKEAKEALKRAAAWMCAIDIKPLSMVNGVGFRNFCHKLNPSFQMPDRHMVGSYVTKIYEEGHAELIKDIKGCPVGLTTDLWTSHANQGYITVTAQYINSAWTQKTRVLGTRAVNKRHTGIQVSDEIHTLLREFEIPKCYGICTDNAGNMKVN